jgi:phage baseplate assembly protein gpV
MQDFFSTFAGYDHQHRSAQSIVRHGQIVDAKMDKKLGPIVKMAHPQFDDLNTTWLQVAQMSTVGMQISCLPRIGAHAVSVHFPGGQERGIVIGCFYNQSTGGIETAAADQVHIKMDDGSTLVFDGSGNVKADLKGSVDLKAKGNVSVQTEGNANVQAKGNTTISAKQIMLNGITIDADNNISGIQNLKCHSGQADTQISNGNGSGGGS